MQETIAANVLLLVTPPKNMRVFFLLVLVVVAASAQPSDHREVPIRASVKVDALWCKPAGGGYDTPFVFRETEKSECEAAVSDLKADFASQRLIHWSIAGDCYLKSAVKAFRNDTERRVRVIVNKIYGGCRASGRLAGVIAVDKPPSGYRVSVEEVGVDEGSQRSFAFPPPPPTVRYEDVSYRQLDLNECLPLLGQSRWMISKEDHLKRNLDGKPNEKECRDKLAASKIDLNTSTLIGVSFQSGFCGEPEGLKLSVMNEISSDRRNFVVVKALHNEAKPPCDRWTTHPVWLVVPKVASGFVLEVDAKTHSRANEPRENAKEPIEWTEK